MWKKAKQEIVQKLSKKHKYLLGLSGGPDSTFLFHVLLEEGIQFEVAHLDHGLREESQKEREVLEKIAHEAQIPFHFATLSYLNMEEPNLEEKCREERYAFFKKIYCEIGADALVLGHHKGDQGETVLKRLFEGGALYGLTGIAEEGIVFAMKVIRPMLALEKNEIITCLKEKNISYFIDKTNFSPTILRGRMRQEMIPFLEESFGKAVMNNIVHLGKEAQEISIYINEQITPFYDGIKKGPMGVFIPDIQRVPPVLLPFFLKKICRGLNITSTRGEIEKIRRVIIEKRERGQAQMGFYSLIYEMGALFFLDRRWIEGAIKNFQAFSIKKEGVINGWMDLLEGKRGEIYGDLQRPVLKERLPNGKYLQDWYSENKVPVFLRKIIPVTVFKGKVVQEHLTGKHL